MNMPIKKNNGFTLIELLVVIAIIGVLASMVLVSMGSSRAKARDARRLTDFRQIIPSQELVMGDDNFYSKSAQSIGTIPATKNSAGRQYLAQLNDPLDDAQYKYVWVDNTGPCNAANLAAGKYYCAITKMEVKEPCANTENHYFIVNQSTQREICTPMAIDYITTLPPCSVCVRW